MVFVLEHAEGKFSHIYWCEWDGRRSQRPRSPRSAYTAHLLEEVYVDCYLISRSSVAAPVCPDDGGRRIRNRPELNCGGRVFQTVT